jgi:hypothetical protein
MGQYYIPTPAIIKLSLRSFKLVPENGQRATMQTPQRLDPTHSGELFPKDVEKADALTRKNRGVIDRRHRSVL